MEQNDTKSEDEQPNLTTDTAPRAKSQKTKLFSRLHAVKSLDDFFFEIRDEIHTLFDVEQATIYTIDRENRELYSTCTLYPLEEVQEIRIPISETSISGYCARFGKLINVANAYDKAELMSVSSRLTFDRTWDELTGFHTRQVLSIPILFERKYLMGVLVLLNRAEPGKFTPVEEELALEIAEILGMAFRNQQHQGNRQPADKSSLASKAKTRHSYLLEQKLITQEDLDAATIEARRKVQDVETVLIEEYRLQKKEVGTSLSHYFDCPFMEFDERAVTDHTLLKGINFDYLKANYWVPLKREESTVDILVDDPKDLQKIEHIELLMKGLQPRFFVGLRKDILQFLYSASGKYDPLDNIQDIIGELSEDGTPIGDEEDSLGIGEDDSAIVRLANQIIVDAYKKGASDIHIEPYSARQDMMVRIRVDGRCEEYQRIPPTYRRALVSRLKIMARLDIAERRKPQDGKIKFRLPTNRDIELRVATIPTSGGNEDVVMRILAASEPIPIDQLQMTERNLTSFQKAVENPYGLILVVGPTGSGKTTTLHSALGYINTPERKIWTAEDPVEITQYGLRQVQVHPRIGLTFAAAMRSFLRADPDVVMVGEMRDEETAHIGIKASLTGHLVLSTLHTNSAAETITRLLDMGLNPFNFGDALLCVLAQRLVRTLCPACKEEHNPPETMYNELRQAYGPKQFDELGITYSSDFTLHKSVGCSECSNTGYKGRVGIHELLLGSPQIKQLIQARARMVDIRKKSMQEGMTTLLQDGILKIIEGLTDFTQVKAVANK